MYYNKFFKLSFAYILFSASLSIASWAMEPSQEDGDKHHSIIGSVGKAQEPIIEEDQPTISEFVNYYIEYVKSLSKIFPYSYYLRPEYDYSSLNEASLYPYYQDYLRQKDADVESLKKVFPHSYYLR